MANQLAFSVVRKGLDPAEVQAYINDLNRNEAEMKARFEELQSERDSLFENNEFNKGKVAEISAECDKLKGDCIKLSTALKEMSMKLKSAAPAAAVDMITLADSDNRIAAVTAECDRKVAALTNEISALREREIGVPKAEVDAQKQAICAEYEKMLASYREQLEANNIEVARLAARTPQTVITGISDDELEAEKRALRAEFGVEREALQKTIAELQTRVTELSAIEPQIVVTPDNAVEEQKNALYAEFDKEREGYKKLIDELEAQVKELESREPEIVYVDKPVAAPAAQPTAEPAEVSVDVSEIVKRIEEEARLKAEAITEVAKMEQADAVALKGRIDRELVSLKILIDRYLDNSKSDEGDAVHSAIISDILSDDCTKSDTFTSFMNDVYNPFL